MGPVRVVRLKESRAEDAVNFYGKLKKSYNRPVYGLARCRDLARLSIITLDT